MSDENIKSAPAGKVGGYTKTSCDSITSAADFQHIPSGDIPGEPANDVVVGQELEGPGVEVCEGALSKWGNACCDGYSYGDGGELLKDGKLISSHYLRAHSFSTTADDHNCNLRVELENNKGHRLFEDIPYGLIVNRNSRDVINILAGRAFSFQPESKEILDYLWKVQPTLRTTQIKKTGWVNDREYISPYFQVKHRLVFSLVTKQNPHTNDHTAILLP
ncbi:MAG: hypothetical protein LBI30_00210 [Holosporales bacterium]|jgi:hypothetical protein|nr:hypothetical protein [Holosporales bacterium]